MLFQNIVKRKKSFGSRCMGGAGVGTASPNRGCNVGASYTTVPVILPAAVWRAQVEMLLVDVN
jgi:hypothetical protein